MFIRNLLAAGLLLVAGAAHAGSITLLGAGKAGGVTPPLVTPAFTPLVSSYFGQSNSTGTTNQGLKLNGGVAGSNYFPSSPSAVSFTQYFEMGVNSALRFTQGSESPFPGAVVETNGLAGQPSFFFNRGRNAGVQGTEWMYAFGRQAQTGASVNATTTYNQGFFPFTWTGSGCQRDPTGIWQPTGNRVQVVDSGFMCPPQSASFQLNAAAITNIPGSGAQQSTTTSPATTCALVNGKAWVTTHVAVAHGLTPGQGYNLSLFTPSGYNGAYTAVSGTTDTTSPPTLVGTTGATSCPGVVSAEGKAFDGTTGVLTYASINANPIVSGPTGIQTKNNQKACFFLGAHGADGPFPGAQYVVGVDSDGNSLPGSPALMPYPNMGTATFVGHSQCCSSQSPANPALTVTGMNTFALTGASFVGGSTSKVQFTVASNPGLTPGSEIRVISASPVGYNQRYVVTSQTGAGPYTIQGNPLTDDGLAMNAISNPGTWASGGTLKSVIVPGMTVLGLNGPQVIMPYGTFTSTGVGDVGTYGLLTQVPTAGSAFTITAVTGSGPWTITVSGTPSPPIVVGTEFSQASGANLFVVKTVVASNQFTVTSYNSTTPTAASAAPYGSIGCNGNATCGGVTDDYSMFAYAAMFNTAAAATTFPGGALTARTQASIGDFVSTFGSSSANVVANGTSFGGSMSNIADIQGVISGSNGVPSTSDLASVCKKTTDIQTYARGKGATVFSHYPLDDVGIWADASYAKVLGYITNAGGVSATLNIVGSPLYGSLALGVGAPAKLTGPGLPVASPVTVPLTTSAGSSYLITPNTTAANGSSGSPIAYSLGQFSPAAPIAATNVHGWTDSSGILHVSSFDTTSHVGYAAFTGSLTNSVVGGTGGVSSTSFVVTSPSYASISNGLPKLGVGTQLSLTPGGSVIATILQQTVNSTGGTAGLGLGTAGTYLLDTAVTISAGTTVYAKGPLPSGPTTLTLSASPTVGTVAIGQAVGDGGVSITGQMPIITGGSGLNWTVTGNYLPAVVSDATMYSTFSTVTPGAYVQNTGIMTPAKVLYYTGACTLSGAFNGGPGCYQLSNSANAPIGSSSSQFDFVVTNVTDGGAIAPGPAFTLSDFGPGTTFPVNHAAGTATLIVRGKYDVPTLGGTPSAIQTSVSYTAGGPPITGCAACAWTTQASTIGSGDWSATVPNIPGSPAPLYVNVRPANGTGYVSMRNPVWAGDIFSYNSEGNGDFVNSTGGFATFGSGLMGVIKANTPYSTGFFSLVGPPITGYAEPGGVTDYAFDRYGLSVGTAAVSNGNPVGEGVLGIDGGLTAVYNNPVTMVGLTRDGVGIMPAALGNSAQAQSVSVGDGTKLTWCSTVTFCVNAGQGGVLTFNGASLTGASFAGDVSLPGGVPTLTVGTFNSGALQPGMLLSDGGVNITVPPTLVRCVTNCTGVNGATSTWVLSASPGVIASEAMWADPPGGAPWLYANAQTLGLGFGLSGGGPAIKPGTFSIKDDTSAAVLATDPAPTTIYNLTGAPLSGTNVDSANSFVNYLTGDYRITFTSGHAPVSGHVLTAYWTNIVTPVNDPGNAYYRPPLNDFVGTGTATSGSYSSVLARAPGGLSGMIYAAWGSTDKNFQYSMGGTGTPTDYEHNASGYSFAVSDYYSRRLPIAVPSIAANTPVYVTGQTHGQGANIFLPANPSQYQGNFDEIWAQDYGTSSTFSGTINSGASELTLTTTAVGPMWEGEVLMCVTATSNCKIGAYSGVYIKALKSGTWGVSGSVYKLAGSPTVVTSAAQFKNAMQYSGSGRGLYIGGLYDMVANQNLTGLNGQTARQPHMAFNSVGPRRVMQRMAAMIAGADPSATIVASDPKVDRTPANASGCLAGALTAPCLDGGNQWKAQHTASWTTAGVFTVTGGIAAHDRPFVVGHLVNCSPACGSNLVITSLSVPPTQSTATGAGEVGQTFTFTTKPDSGGSLPASSTSGTATAGCKGTAGTGASCIDIAISINVSGTFGTTASLSNCGANNLAGNGVDYANPAGTCASAGIGALARGFMIGTQQTTNGDTTPPPFGNNWDDGVTPVGSTTSLSAAFTQSGAFTCNIVAVKVVQCVKGPAYSSGVFASAGQWNSYNYGAGTGTFISYGDLNIATGRQNSLLGYVGAQSFPITAGGTGYSNQTIDASCSNKASGGFNPTFDIWTTGGVITSVLPSATGKSSGQPMGLAIGADAVGSATACTLTPTGGSGATIPAIVYAPLEGKGGIDTLQGDVNMSGMFIYDNSALPGNPLNSIIRDGFETGLPLRPFGQFQGLPVGG